MAQYTLTPLTGVHIGTGEELTPLDYKLAHKIGNKKFSEIEEKPYYFKFSSDRILQRLMQEKNQQKMTAFERASVKGNMKELQQFFQDNCVTINDTDYICEITEGFCETYKANEGKDPYENAGIVMQMYHTPGTPRPVIPGSSIKGSIRTALLNMYLDDLPNEEHENLRIKTVAKPDFIASEDYEYREEERIIQQKLFEHSDAQNDPLRAVLIPDCSFKVSSTQIQLVGRLVNVFSDKQKKKLEPAGPSFYAEVIKGDLLGGSEVSKPFSININDKLQKIPFKTRADCAEKHLKEITLDNIQRNCNDFYWNEFVTEYDKFYKDLNDGTKELIDTLKNKLEEARNSKDQFILRVGRWSQVEFVTFEEQFRRPIVKKDKKGNSKYGTTRTLFVDNDGKYIPLGWCILTEQK